MKESYDEDLASLVDPESAPSSGPDQSPRIQSEPPAPPGSGHEPNARERWITLREEGACVSEAGPSGRTGFFAFWAMRPGALRREILDHQRGNYR